MANLSRSMLSVLLAGVLALPSAGCRRAAPTAESGDWRTYPVRGRVVSVDAAHGTVLLSHDAIPGFMEAMTMPYPLRQPEIAGELHPGDRITATLRVRMDRGEPAASELDQIVVTAQERPDYKPSASFHVPAQGDAVPDFRLIGEDGRKFDLAGLKGKAVLLTFIYTRCPLPEFCPRMNRNFAEVERELVADPALYARTRLLSVSFDPEHDSPQVLKSYALAYRGGNVDHGHWEFAVPPAAELKPMLTFFDVGATPAQDGTLTHSLSTTVIGPDGRVRAWYPTNEWTPEQAVKALREAAG